MATVRELHAYFRDWAENLFAIERETRGWDNDSARRHYKEKTKSFNEERGEIQRWFRDTSEDDIQGLKFFAAGLFYVICHPFKFGRAYRIESTLGQTTEEHARTERLRKEFRDYQDFRDAESHL
ncbi:MAG: hypothetical protein HYW25_05620 [Candidatus Aenigmarchaeota archaeon]|nr:hypothetical protein [Candidatus Aenigmarchaeota archaeon]